MKHCDSCNIDLSGSFQFCPTCASSLTDSRRCSGCGELAKNHWEFCASCGRALPLVASQTLRTSGSGIAVVQAESSIAQQPESFQHSFEASQEATVSQTELRDDVFQGPSGTKQNGTECNRTAVDSEATQVALNSTGSYESDYPSTKRAQAITGFAEHDSERLISHVIPNQPIEARTPPIPTWLQSYGPMSEPLSQWRWRQTVLGLILVCLAGALCFGGWYWWSQRSIAAPPSVESRIQNEVAAQEKPSNSPVTQSAPLPAPNNLGADEEFTALHDRGIGAKLSDRSQIIAALENAERKYANDYRFPYERAKLTIVGVHAHDESFAALMRAAEIAIDNGEAELMMENLTADKSGDLRKLSHGHLEWSIVEKALRNRNKDALKTVYTGQSDDH